MQDAGLIFLSAMSGAIAASTTEPQHSIISTTVIILPICTFLLGGMLIVVSRLKLASVIQYLPMPVIGGYLAFIGFFCGQAGLAMMANVQVCVLLHMRVLHIIVLLHIIVAFFSTHSVRSYRYVGCIAA